VDTGYWFSKVVYYTLLLFVFVAFLSRLNLAFAAAPIQSFLNSVTAFLPRILAALALGLVAWIVARIIRRMVKEVLRRIHFDKKLAETTDSQVREGSASSSAVGEVSFWLVLLLFLPAVLDTLALDGILEPVQGMLSKTLAFMPQLLSAAAIFVVGWFAAKILQRIVTNLLAAAGLDGASEKFGIAKALGDTTLSKVVGMIVHILVVIPVTVAALGALQLESVTKPASSLLSTLLNAVPAIFGATIVLSISYLVGRFVATLVSNILAGIGFNHVLVRLGLAKIEPVNDDRAPAAIAGHIVLVAIMLFAAMEAADMLGFDRVSLMVADVTELAGRVLLGLFIVALGLLLGDLASKAIRGSEMKNGKALARFARVAILALVGSMGLQQMGLGEDIILLAFALTLGAGAIAFALAFGLGGREEAGKVLRDWRERANE